MRAGDDGTRRVFAGGDSHFNMEYRRGIREQGDVDALLVYIIATALDGFRSDVGKHLELVSGVAGEHTEGDSYRQAYHAGAGYAHAHGVLDDVGTGTHVNPIGDSPLGEQLGGDGSAKGNCRRLGAADSRNYLTVHQRNYLFSFLLFYHGLDSVNKVFK